MNWLMAKFSDVCEIIMGQSPKSKYYNTEKKGLPFFQGKMEFGDVHPTPRKWCSKPLKIAKKNDILISVRAPVGPTNICQETSCIGRGLVAIRYLAKDAHKFLFYYLRSIESKLANIGTGSTFSAISKSQVSNLKIPLPPLPEQHRIVAKIEELFTRLDAGVEALKKIKAQLKRYRQAVLKYAFEGKLTQEWREANKDKLEPASILLERIKEERKAKLGKKYKDLPPVDTSELPEGWVWTRVGEIAEKIKPGFPSGKHNKEKRGIPHLRPMNVSLKGYIDLSTLKFIEEKEYEPLLKGDVLFNNTNSPELLGKTSYIKQDTNWAYSNHMTRIRVYKNFINPAWLAWGLHYFF